MNLEILWEKEQVAEAKVQKNGQKYKEILVRYEEAIYNNRC